MNEEKLKQAYDKMTPDAQTEKRILARILVEGEGYMEKKVTSQPIKNNRWVAIPAAVALLAVIALGVFVVTRFDQVNNAMNSPDQDGQNATLGCTDETKDEQETTSEMQQGPEPMTIPSFEEPDGGCTPEDTQPVTQPLDTVLPLPETLDIANLDNCTVAVSFDKGSVLPSALSIYPAEIKVTVYTYDQYDMVDIGLLDVGDSITINQQVVVVLVLERDNYVVRINGGLDNGGYDLRTDDDGVYYETGYSDMKSWNAIGVVTLPVSADFILTDDANPDNPGTTYSLDDLLDNDAVFGTSFTPHNTTIVIEDGVVTQMHRRYTP